ncbi:disease resistance protein RPP2B-like isoform X2 [Carya illinoinensis]|nr:disease resistance protein RPP2B-like isoform X2 [Carya illinoinensis]
MHVQDVTEILDSCGFPATIGINILREKCLINIDKFDHVEMHDLLQQMGKEVVRRKSTMEAGRRSRLWCHKDVRDVLEDNTGTRKIEGISLDFPGGHDEVRLCSKAFMKMKKLRLFINHNAQISGVPKYLSNELSMLRWSKYSSSSLPSNFNGNNLCIFRMRHSLIKKLDGLKLKNLREMDLSFSKFLTKIPDLSSSANLKKVNLQYCENLVEVHCSVGFLDKLSDFLVNGCSKLRIFPERFKLRSLCLLQLYDCSSLQDFPEILCEMKFLYHICLRGTSITELPSSIEKLTELQSLDLNGIGIKELPSSIGKLTKLERLCARDCKDLVHLPSSIHQLHRLCSLKLDRCSQAINIREVEEDGTQSTASVVCKGQYEIESSAELTSINSSIFNDGSSSSANWAPLALSLQFCCLSESNFFTDANYFPTLVELDLSGSDIVIFPQDVRFAGLKNLCLNNCKQLAEILPLPLSIAKVEARGCTSLKSFAELSKIFFNNNGRNSSGLKIDLYGCLQLLVNMMLPSWEERDSKEKNREDHLEARIMGIIFSGERIPSWFSYWREADNSNSCEIDINGPHYRNQIEEIILCVVIGFRAGIIYSKMETEICVGIHDGRHWNDLCNQHIRFDCSESDHVWLGCFVCPYNKGNISRFKFECDSELVVFKSVGVHLVKKHEENVRDQKGVLH